MQAITHPLKFDLQCPEAIPALRMKQYEDMSREIVASFMTDGADWHIPADVTVVQLAFCKSDGVGGLYDKLPDNSDAATISTARTSVTVKIHPQVLTCAGIVSCELRLRTSSGVLLSTYNFTIYVEKSPVAMATASESYYHSRFDGATFTPHIVDGVLSWTNDKGLPNPEPIRIGAVASVNGEEPDASGNVSVTAADVPYQKTIGSTETHDVAEALDALADTLDGVEDLLAAI